MKLLNAKGVLSLIIFFLLFFPINTNAQSRLLALSKKEHTLAIVDPSNLKVLARVPVGNDPHEVIASSDGKTAYVSIYGGGSLHSIDVIDVVAQKPLYTIDTRPLFGPHGLVFVQGKVWFSAEGSKAVGRYDPSTRKLEWCMGTGQERTHMLYVTADGMNVFTSNVSSGSISILENTNHENPPFTGRQNDWALTTIATSKGCEGFDVSPDGKELWAAAASDGAIFIIDPVTKKIKSTIDAKILGANRLKFTPDGKMVFISSLASGKLSVFDATTRKEIKKIDIGHGAAGIEMNPDGSSAFVACTPDNYIAVINLKTLEVTGRIDAGATPDGLAWSVQPE